VNRDDFLSKISIAGKSYNYYDITKLKENGIDLARLPFSIRILLENILRKLDDKMVKKSDLEHIASWQQHYQEPVEIPYHPGRVLMQDFTGVPAIVDLAAMRDAIEKLHGDTEKINPLIPVELIVDHSIQVDHYGSKESLSKNVAKEFARNGERYSFLKWAQKNFKNFKVVPPNSGICHQVNLEYLARVISNEPQNGRSLLYPDTLVGTDSHTTMINGVGVMGWGVGGIEAEAVMLGQPYFMAIPEVIGVKLTGRLAPGITATDLVLRITELLRAQNVVEKFVEFFGEGSKNLKITDRATIANMSPEYGATMGFFPVDEKTIEYLKLTNRQEQAEITEAYTKACGMFYTGSETPEYSKVVELDLSQVEPSLAGPSRPQDRLNLTSIKAKYRALLKNKSQKNASLSELSNFFHESGCVTCRQESCIPCRNKKEVQINIADQEITLTDGSLVIAAITSCTNTSNPSVLIGAGLLARNAVEKGLKVPSYVKTSLAPGSKVVIDYLKSADLLKHLETLGFYLAGFGCTTCIGNSGPLHPLIDQAISDHDLSVAAILSGNRNFEARIHQNIKGNFLASPLLVVAFALCGRIDIDLTKQPLGVGADGKGVFLKDIWPKDSEIESLIKKHVRPDFFKKEYGQIFDGDDLWRQLQTVDEATFSWDNNSEYIKNPPYFQGFSLKVKKPGNIKDARVLLIVGDSLTTDHISPAGGIPASYPAGRYLLKQGVEAADFNSYGSRRGNHQVMIRGTFGNIRLKNQLVSPKEGSFTKKFPENSEMDIYQAAMAYQKEKTPLVVLAGKEYGTGSSRDWAAKGTNLLGIKAVIAQSYERIHRSNLVGMGVLPLEFISGESWQSLGLDGSEIFTFEGINGITPRKIIQVTATSHENTISFQVIARLNTEIDVAYYQHGGILPYVLRRLSHG